MTREDFINALDNAGISFDDNGDWIDDNLSAVYECLKNEVINTVAKFAFEYNTDSFSFSSLEEATETIKGGNFLDF